MATRNKSFGQTSAKELTRELRKMKLRGAKNIGALTDSEVRMLKNKKKKKRKALFAGTRTQNALR